MSRNTVNTAPKGFAQCGNGNGVPGTVKLGRGHGSADEIGDNAQGGLDQGRGPSLNRHAELPPQKIRGKQHPREHKAHYPRQTDARCQAAGGKSDNHQQADDQ